MIITAIKHVTIKRQVYLQSVQKMKAEECEGRKEENLERIGGKDKMIGGYRILFSSAWHSYLVLRHIDP
jgi:hypothetical protein